MKLHVNLTIDFNVLMSAGDGFRDLESPEAQPLKQGILYPNYSGDALPQSYVHPFTFQII